MSMYKCYTRYGGPPVEAPVEAPCPCTRRYMDDLLVFYARNDSWDEARFLQDIGGHCYLPPLKLEDGTAGTFLETSFEITGNTIRHWLKNENVTGEPPKIWRYSHFDSHGQFSQKKATLMACLTKVQKMASDDPALRKSAPYTYSHRYLVPEGQQAI